MDRRLLLSLPLSRSAALQEPDCLPDGRAPSFPFLCGRGFGALSLGITPNIVMKWTGHSDYQAMKPYIAIAEKTKADAMKLFDEELKK